ncbi:hypothetical protein ACFOUV_04960 [Oceanobacillus longus]|uniref:Flagellar hook-length control protein-like C-terminal domain-containing protein n=1 Tax=Oceanobacillus longus TaxID=930120 RepID=A0ABV8GU93_9BACI
MSIHKVIGERMSKILHAQQNLRPGQIIQGKILKIYPDNKAQIQLGSQRMIAQLEASLSIEGKYHFQVQASDELIHLKVLGGQLQSQSRNVALNLMGQLGLKATKSNISFMQKMVRENIPFDRSQVNNALQILDTAKQKVKAEQVLMEMIARKLPITENVFNALEATKRTDLTNQMREMVQQLKNGSINMDLSIKLEQLTEPPRNQKESMLRQIITDNNSNRQHVFQVLKSVGILSPTIDFTSWKSEWKQLEVLLRQNDTPLTKTDIRMPFQLNTNTVVQVMEQVDDNKQVLFTESKEILNQMEAKLRQSILTSSVLIQEDFSSLKEQLTQKIAPQLSVEQGQFIKAFSNNPVQLERVLTLLQTFNDQRTFTHLSTTLEAIKMDSLFSNASPKEQFSQQINQVLKYMGLSYENQLSTNLKEENQSIKSMLLQLGQMSDGPLQEKAGQLIHYINGMQINSVSESANFIQASLQIPAEKWGLNKDMELEFESRKTADGKIDPDYCRILFYLDLEHLKQTVIDMNIQKRSVSVTIYNDEYPKLKNNTMPFQPVLIQGLNSLNYHLSSVHFKPLQEQKITNRETTKFYHSSYQGVDYRV